MRDLFLVSALIPILLFTFKRPQIGVLAWLWISVMNPHRLTYGFIYSFPLLDFIVLVTMFSCLINYKKASFPSFNSILILLVIFYLWTCLTTFFGVDSDLSHGDWLAFTKTLLLMVFILLYMNKKHWLFATVAVFTLSIAMTGVKGGLYTVLTGGGSRIFGPPGTAWGDNNGVSVAMLIVTPLVFAFSNFVDQKYQKWMIYGATALCFACLLGTHSRGGLVGLLGVVAFVIMRSNKKFISVIVLGFTLIIGYNFMPSHWHERMGTIKTYEEDASSMQRIIQWKYAIDIAKERPLFGNGFDAFYHQPYYYKYIAHIDENRAVHSNYFQVLGEHGFIGIGMFLLLIFLLIQKAEKAAKKALKAGKCLLEANFLKALQFSIVGFSANGLTVNMAYLDLYYYLIAFVVMLIWYVEGELNRTIESDAATQNKQPLKQSYI